MFSFNTTCRVTPYYLIVLSIQVTNHLPLYLYSHPHQTFSHIDHIFLTIGMIPEFLTSNIIPILWSDHSAVYTTIASTIPKAHDPSWYIPNILLKNPSHRIIIEQTLKEYLIHNTCPEISPLTLCEAYKPVLRGVFQRQSAMFK